MHSLLPALAIAFNALVWGLSWWPLHQLQALGLHPLWSTVLMYSVPVAGMLLWRRPQALGDFRRHAGLWWLLLASGLTNTCFNWAVTIGDVIRVVLLFYLMPVWAALLAWWLLGERPTFASLLRVALALAGVALVMQPAGVGWGQWRLPWPSGLADVLALLGGFFFACTNVLLGKITAATPASRVFAMFAGGVLMGGFTATAALHLGLHGVTPVPPAAAQWIGLVVLFSLGFIASNLALQYGAARLSAHTMSLIMLLEVLFASVSSALAGAAVLTTQTLAGGLLVMSAALLAAWAPHR